MNKQLFTLEGHFKQACEVDEKKRGLPNKLRNIYINITLFDI